MKIICSIVQDSFLRFPEITGCFYYVSGKDDVFYSGLWKNWCILLLLQHCPGRLQKYVTGISRVIYIERERCTPKQWNRPKIQVCFPVTACTEFYAFWSILHLPTLKCFFFFVLFSNKAGGGGKSNNHRRGGMIDHLLWVVFISTSSESSFDASPPHSLEWNSVSVGNTFQWYHLTPHLSIAKLVIEVRHVGGGHKQKAEIRLGLRCLWSASP